MSKDVRVSIEWDGVKTLSLTAFPGEEPGDVEVRIEGGDLPTPNAIFLMCYGLYQTFNIGGKLSMDELMRYIRGTMEMIEEKVLVIMDKAGDE